MKYTYRDECIIRDKSEIGGFVILAIFSFLTLVLFLMDPYLIIIEGKEGFGSALVGGLFGIFTFAMAMNIRRTINRRRSRALKKRRDYMDNGIRCDGRIVDAGTEMETESYQVTEDDGRSETRFMRIPNYWIVVEYCLPETGEVKRFRDNHFVKSMESFIGSSVNVYVWYKWCDILNKKSPFVYIDTYGLN